MMVRPPEDVVNVFYGLAELDDTTRLKAAATLVQCLKRDENIHDYCMERLISGLASARAAARLGYSTALTRILEDSSWSLKKILAYCDKQLDFTKKDFAQNNGIAQHLLFTCLLRASKFHKDRNVLIEREMSLLAHFPFLSLSICHLLAQISLSLDNASFDTTVWPHLRPKFSEALKPEFLIVLLLLRKKFSKTMSSTKLVTPKGALKWNDLSETFLVDILKGANTVTSSTVLSLWLSAGKEDGQWAAAIQLLTKWATVEPTKASQRLFVLTKDALRMCNNVDEVSATISTEFVSFVSKSKHDNTPSAKTNQNTLREIVQLLEEKIEGSERKEKEEAFVELLRKMDKCHLHIFSHSKITEKLLLKLDENQFTEYVQECKPESLRRLPFVFPQLAPSLQKVLLTFLVSRESSFVLLASCIDGLFKIKIRPSESATAILSEESERILTEVVDEIAGSNTKKALKTIGKKAGGLKRPLSVLYMCLFLWRQDCPSWEKEQYGDMQQELVGMAENVEPEVLVDLLISLLALPHKFHRTIACFVFSSLLPLASSDLLNHIIETMSMSNSDLAKGDQEEDDDGEEDEEGEEEEESEQTDDESEEEAESESEGEVDSQLVDRLQEALGDAAVKRKDGDQNEEESEAEDLDDAAMFSLDSGLASVFKALGKTSQSEVARMAVPLRMRLADLLLFAFSSQETPVLVKMDSALALLRAIKELLKKGEDASATNKAVQLVNIVTELKKADIPEKKTLSLLSLLVEESASMSNPFLSDLFASFACFLLSNASRPSLSPRVRDAFIGVFREFLAGDRNIPSEVATAPIIRHPVLFAPDFSLFVESAFDESIRIFRRTESLQCALALARRDLLSESGKEMARVVAEHSSPFLATLPNPDAKPRFVASILKLLLLLTHEESSKKVLSRRLLSSVTRLLEDEGAGLAKCNSACQRLCGKSARATLEAIRNKIE